MISFVFSKKLAIFEFLRRECSYLKNTYPDFSFGSLFLVTGDQNSNTSFLLYNIFSRNIAMEEERVQIFEPTKVKKCTLETTSKQVSRSNFGQNGKAMAAWKKALL